MSDPTITRYVYSSPLGPLTLASYGQQLCLCNWQQRTAATRIEKRIQTQLNGPFNDGDNALLQQTRQQLDQYFEGQRTQFNLPILTLGTAFQKQVWQALQTINYGQSISYSQLAQLIEQPKAVRAVANANAANALSIIIPCHRVIAADGSLGGYAGGLDVKHALLALEHGITP